MELYGILLWLFLVNTRIKNLISMVFTTSSWIKNNLMVEKMKTRRFIVKPVSNVPILRVSLHNILLQLYLSKPMSSIWISLVSHLIPGIKNVSKTGKNIKWCLEQKWNVPRALEISNGQRSYIDYYYYDFLVQTQINIGISMFSRSVLGSEIIIIIVEKIKIHHFIVKPV